MGIRFHKMHGLGNDFIIIDTRHQPLHLSTKLVTQLCDRHFGIGCDQLVLLDAASRAEATIRVRFFNPDGSEAGACGNASRCVAALSGGKAVLETAAGLLPCDMNDAGQITVDMGPPRLDWAEIPLAHACDTTSLPIEGAPAACSMGNPHATFFDGVAAAATSGPVFECDPIFPQRANIGFAEIEARDKMRLRVWERGAGLTLACGSGACAAVVNGVRRGLIDRSCRVILDGGTLDITYRDDDHVLMTGPASYVFEGEFPLV
ncbi:diaminopimelate epimerase [Candidatus Kirkpatrickella diaphorinae]|uniref:Diaminopimelate epimerase n=1 Tax=Candidatus Kirkpatrickella diaphorinae TaxID=2984322 RepID=A0ABY6GIM6_9PROT|nr:diaminopimelate epimerase [Candidatus Kirkpatrickella diaphorinae]UYH51174.1 diaminopimelate epimerase [Candidatus Kirkpatrickella diaphorinae]